MYNKIKLRLTWNYGNHLNKSGMAPVALECRQGKKKIYISSNVMLYPGQWNNGMVVNHVNAEKLTAYLIQWRNEIEGIEISHLLKNKHITLYQLKNAAKSGIKPDMTLKEFTGSVVNNSGRSITTKQSYKYMCDDIEKVYGKNITVADIDHDFIENYRNYMLNVKGLRENTVKGRLKSLRCIINEALKRNLITDDPFKFIVIGNMTARVEYLDKKEIEQIENLELTGIQDKVRDMFLLSFYTGLRWSDIATLEDAIIENGNLRKKMCKTKFWVNIPIDTLFWGKGRKIIDKYLNITDLSHCCCNTTANKILKELAKKAGIKKNLHMHIARKTCSQILNEMGMSIQDVSIILGHRDTKTTSRHYIFDNGDRVKNAANNLFA